MVVVAVIALLASLAVPGMIRARKRSQAASIRQDLRLIDDAMEQYGAENNLRSGANITVIAWRGYLKPNTRLYVNNTNVFGDTYGDQKVGIMPSVPANTWDVLSDVCDTSFWAPYTRGQ